MSGVAESARTRANRANAARSTGPKSAAGKARAAQNARRHGLAVAVAADPDFALKIEPLARALAGRQASPALSAAATAVAETYIELMRVRECRLALLRAYLLPRGWRPSWRCRLSRQGSYFRITIRRGVLVEYVDKKPGPVAPWDAAEHFRAALLRLERYEARAIARRRRAVADLQKLELQAEGRIK